ncbi:MAG: hypothetical protein FWD64_12300 [Acidobacteriaceae bacterium]|nr:hypothetical protein [Acidobacteriaceae bacterium]
MPPLVAENSEPTSKLKTRMKRACSVTAKLTEEENEQVITAATNEAKTVSEWLRDVAVRATKKETPSAPKAEPDPVFCEIVFTRSLLYALMQHMAVKSGIAPDEISKVVLPARQNIKQKAVSAWEIYIPKTTTKTT